MVKIIIERKELESILKERFGTSTIKWNANGNALVEMDASEILTPFTEDKDKE